MASCIYFPELLTACRALSPVQSFPNFLTEWNHHQASLNVSTTIDLMHFLLPGRAETEKVPLGAVWARARHVQQPSAPSPPQQHVDKPVSLSHDPALCSRAQSHPVTVHTDESQRSLRSTHSCQQPSPMNGAPSDS